MSNKNRRSKNPDFRHDSSTPLPQIGEIEKKLKKLLCPSVFIRLHRVEGYRLRDRILTLQVMVAMVMTFIYRRVPSASEVVRVAAKEKLLWLSKTVKVTQQAFSHRLRTLPASLFASLLRSAIALTNKTKTNKTSSLEQQKILKHFCALWIADGSTLEALKKSSKV